jgi:hypothetical protein
MARKANYKRYDHAVKAAISMTGRTDLFPDMDIPRMTALYWIRKGIEIDDPFSRRSHTRLTNQNPIANHSKTMSGSWRVSTGYSIESLKSSVFGSNGNMSIRLK